MVFDIDRKADRVVPPAVGTSTVGNATATTTAAQLVAANPSRIQLFVYNNDPTNTVYISGVAGVTAGAGATRGMAVPPGGERVWLGTGAVYVIANAGTPNVSYQDDSY